MQFKMYVRSCIYVTAEQYVAFFHGIDLIISSTYLFNSKIGCTSRAPNYIQAITEFLP